MSTASRLYWEMVQRELRNERFVTPAMREGVRQEEAVRQHYDNERVRWEQECAREYEEWLDSLDEQER